MCLRVVCTVLSVLPALSASELCTTLSRLESRLLSRGGAEELLSINRRYTEALAAWGWTSLRSADERRCRVSALGEALCRDARAFLPTAPPPSETATSTWANMMAELSAHETNESACARFDQSHVLNWNPPVWGWAGCTRSRIFPANVPPFKHMPELTSAAFAWEYGPSYCDHTAVTVTPQLQEALQVSAAALRRKGAIAAAAAADSRAAQPRLNMTGETTVIVSHFKCLRQSLQLEVASLGALLEFGGGTSGLGALLPHLGFGGVHVVHDLPPMILLQRYWLRHAECRRTSSGSTCPRRWRPPTRVGRCCAALTRSSRLATAVTSCLSSCTAYVATPRPMPRAVAASSRAAMVHSCGPLWLVCGLFCLGCGRAGMPYEAR